MPKTKECLSLQSPKLNQILSQNQAGQAGLDLSGPLKPTSIGGSDKGTGILG
jgi:hypothetical protein